MLGLRKKSRLMFLMMVLFSGCGGKASDLNKIYCLEEPQKILSHSISEAKQLDIYWDPNESKGWVAECGNDSFFKNINIITFDKNSGASRGSQKSSKIERVIFRTELFSGKEAESYLQPVLNTLKNKFGDGYKEINLKYGEESLPAILWEKGDFLVLYGFPHKEGGLDNQQYYNFELIFLPSDKRWW